MTPLLSELDLYKTLEPELLVGHQVGRFAFKQFGGPNEVLGYAIRFYTRKRVHKRWLIIRLHEYALDFEAGVALHPAFNTFNLERNLRRADSVKRYRKLKLLVA